MAIDKALEKEYQFYLSQSDEWKKQNHGKWVIIKDQKIVDIYTTYEDTFKKGIEKFGNIQFLIHQVGSEERVNYNTFSLLGIS